MLAFLALPINHYRINIRWMPSTLLWCLLLIAMMPVLDKDYIIEVLALLDLMKLEKPIIE